MEAELIVVHIMLLKMVFIYFKIFWTIILDETKEKLKSTDAKP